jgi:hypothetical protein
MHSKQLNYTRPQFDKALALGKNNLMQHGTGLARAIFKLEHGRYLL